ncbi:hypothetical protein [Saccharopolyspora taberi]|uniref:hypothetical protein n=1 Tax=Saccharopolyspora taberi TaxID=60895 RepID=UPI0031DB026D
MSELRAARRMSGGPGHVAILADCERALGRPERALELSRSPEAVELEGEEAVELRIVAAGARRDLGEVEASVVSLQIPELDPQRQDPWSARLFYAYADNLLAADRVQEAFTWFVHAAHADDEGETDAPERLDELMVQLGGPEMIEELVTEAEAVVDAGVPDGGDLDELPEGDELAALPGTEVETSGGVETSGSEESADEVSEPAADETNEDSESSEAVVVSTADVPENSAPGNEKTSTTDPGDAEAQ